MRRSAIVGWAPPNIWNFRRAAAALVVGLSLVCAFPASAQSIATEPLPVLTVDFKSPSVNRKLKYNLILPEDYETSDKRYPVLYLLHGYSQDYTAWVRHGAARHARGRGLIVVMPDAGNSFYVNWAEVPDGDREDWEDYITRDLIPHVDATYRTIARREGRAITGLSMGGYGALVIGLRNPELFATIGSHSGALLWARRMRDSLAEGKTPDYPGDRSRLSTEERERIGIAGFSSQLQRMPKGQMFTTVEECDAHDPFVLALDVPRDELPHIYVDCGTDDPYYGASEEFARLLIEEKIPFTYGQSPGEHRGAYWSREVGHSMAVQAEIMRRSLAAVQNDKQ